VAAHLVFVGFVSYGEYFRPDCKFYFGKLSKGGEHSGLERWRNHYNVRGVKRKKRPNRTEQEKLDDYLNALRRKRLAKNLSEQQLRRACVPPISPSRWHRELKPGEKRQVPNASHKERLHVALTNLPKRPYLLKVGRPSKEFKAKCLEIEKASKRRGK
jgi:hypothetical protein